MCPIVMIGGELEGYTSSRRSATSVLKVDFLVNMLRMYMDTTLSSVSMAFSMSQDNMKRVTHQL